MNVETQFVPDLPQFGRFRATAELGSGAMGTVYRAEDDTLGREVAIKTLHASRHDPVVRDRFFQEARAVSVLAHPNVVSIFDMGTHDEAPYLVMELATGGSLKQRIARGTLSLQEAREVGIQIAHALAAAHGKQILHRDVKPANILLAKNGAWKLADFGIARLPDSRLTVTGQFLGSPSYAAPESLTRGQFSPASDVYGLAATIYEALCGQPPHGDKALTALFTGVVCDVTPLRERIAVPDGVDRALSLALAADPARRPTAADFARMLADASDAVPRVSEPVTTGSPSTSGAPRRQRWVLVGLAAIALIGIVAAVTSSGERNPAPAAALPSASPQASESAPESASDEASDREALDDEPVYDEPRRGRGKGKKKKHRD